MPHYHQVRWLTAMITLTALVGCIPVGGATLVVHTHFPNDQRLNSIEMQHLQYSHAEAVTGFANGIDTVEYDVVPGRYCVERLVFDLGEAGSIVRPTNECFEVAEDTPTSLWIRMTASGPQIQSDHPYSQPASR